MGNPWDYDFSAIGRTAPLLIVHGGDVDPAAKKQGGGFVGRGNSDIYKLLGDNAVFEQVNLSKAFQQNQPRPDVARFERVLNLVTDPDQHKRTLESLEKMLRKYRGQVINRPEAVLRTSRDQVAKRLAGIAGLHVPKVIRLRGGKPDAAVQAAERAGFAFPGILRRAGTHTGDIVGLVAGSDELRAGLTGAGDHVLTEFVDFRSADGLYRKYRFFVFGSKAVFRHMIAADNWDIHARDRLRFMVEHPRLLEEEARLLEREDAEFPLPVHSVLEAIRLRLGLDFFGVDFGIAQSGDVILFEANATMNFFPFLTDPRFAYVQRCMAPAQGAFRQLLGQP
jgi:hypothetical protein